MTESPSVSAQVAARVRQLRQRSEMSMAELADQLRAEGLTWTRSTVAKMETGRRESLSVDALVALAAVFRLPPADLLAATFCAKCLDSPPRGYTCNECGKST